LRDVGTTWEPAEGAGGRVTALVFARYPAGSDPTADRRLAQTDNGVVEVTLRAQPGPAPMQVAARRHCVNVLREVLQHLLNRHRVRLPTFPVPS
jgi:hypothetical protein